MPKFSILTACFNGAKFLKDCANSVLSQTVSDWEWIVVDDCSTDLSWDILKQYKDPRIKVLHNNERIFCSSSYRKVLLEATGELCGILDADDGLSKNAIEVIQGKYKKYPDLTYIYTQHYWCDKNLKPVRKGLSAVPNGSFVEFSLKRSRHCFSHWRTCRREIGIKCNMFPPGLKYAVDKYMGFALEETGNGGFLDECLYYYRYHKENMSLTVPALQKSTWRDVARIFHRKRITQNKKDFKVKKI